MTSYNEKKEKVCFNQISIFLVGAGGFGGKRNSDKVFSTAQAPKRQADRTVKETTSIDQVSASVFPLLLLFWYIIVSCWFSRLRCIDSVVIGTHFILIQALLLWEVGSDYYLETMCCISNSIIILPCYHVNFT